MKNAVLYLRFSSSGQNEQTIDCQRDIDTKFCKENHINIVGEYIDKAKTGTSDNRPAFQRMIADAEKQSFDYIVVYTLDRFARNKDDTGYYRYQLMKNGVTVLSATEDVNDKESETALWVRGIMEIKAQAYSMALSKRVRDGNQKIREAGRFNGGRTIYGYTLVDHKYIIDDEKANIVRAIFNESLHGATAPELSAKYGLNKNSIYKMLRNGKYADRYEYEGIKYSLFPRIIDDKTFDSLQEMRASREHSPASYKAREPYYLSGKVFCGECGAKMVGTSAQNKGRTYYYYMCKDTCGLKRIRKEYLEEFVAEATRNRINDIETIEYMTDELYAYQENALKTDAEYSSLKQEQSSLTVRINNLVNAIADGDAPKPLIARLSEFEKRQEEVNEAIAEIVRGRSHAFTRDELKDHIIKRINSRQKALANTLVNNLIKKVIIFNDRVVIIYNFTNSDEDFDVREITGTLLKRGKGRPRKEIINSYLPSSGAPIGANTNFFIYKGYIGIVLHR